MTPLLVVEGLEVVYQRTIAALQGVSFTVRKNQIVALIGSNGAGKTTSLRAISGFIGLDDARISNGRILYNGELLNGLRPPEVTRRRLVLVPEREKIFPNLTVAENLAVVVGHGEAAFKRQESLVYEFFPRLALLRRRQAGLLSGGERQMLAIGAALMCHPETLMVDELSMGLAPVVIEDLIQRLIDIRREMGLTLLLVEQSAAAVLKIADYAFVLENGRVALHGDAAKLRGDDRVRTAYLGLSDVGRVNYRHARLRRLDGVHNG